MAPRGHRWENTLGRWAQPWAGGGLVDGDEAESLTVVRGSLETHINVATLDGSYSIIVDNRSGKTRVIDENDIAARSDPHGDHVDAPLAELPPMPPPAQG